MTLKLLKLLLLISAAVVVSGCGIARFDVDADLTCGDLARYDFTVSEFPADFVGKHLLTLGMWFKLNLPSDNSFTGRFILFMLTQDTIYEEPSVSFQRNGNNVDVYHTYHLDSTYLPRDLVPHQWYFGIESCNAVGVFVFSVIDPSVSNYASLVLFRDEVSPPGSSSTYTDSFKLYFGAVGSYSQSCTAIWKPFMITDYAVPEDDTRISLAFGIEPFPTYSFTLQPYRVYENLFDYSDDTSILQTQNEPGLNWSTNKESYPLQTYYSFSDPTFSSIFWPHSFLNSNGSISFSMRIRVKFHSFPECDVHWLVRRFSPDGELIFGFGINNGFAKIYFPEGPQEPFFSYVADWQEIYLSCQSQFLPQTICTLFEGSEMDIPEVMIFADPQYNGKETTNDILLLGPGFSPWEDLTVPQNCGSISILSLTISLGANAFPLDNCFGGCMIKSEGPNSKCYVQDTATTDVACPPHTVWTSGSKDCIPCPLGCAACTVSDPMTYAVRCTSCSQNFTLLSASGICGCVGSYYFHIDPGTKQGKCIAKQQISTIITMNSSLEAFTFNISGSPIQFNSPHIEIEALLPLVRVYLEGALLNLEVNYSIKFDTFGQILITLAPNATIFKNSSIFSVDFSAYNQIEGYSTMIVPTELNYTFAETFYYVDTQTLHFARELGKYTAIGSYMDLTSASSLALISDGASGSSVFLLHAKGELAMYKYLNVKFPKNFVAYIGSHQASSTIPNVYAYMNENENVAISTYYKFGEWKTPVLFIEKYGQQFIKENIVFILVIVTWFPFRLCKKKGNKKPGIFDKIHYVFRWNLLISFFAADLTPFLVQIGLQFKEVPFVSADGYTILSTSISVIVLFSYFLIFAGGIYQINRKRIDVPEYMKSARRRLESRIEKEKFPLSMAIYTQEFKGEVGFDRNFLLIAKFEYVLLSLNYIFMQDMPLAQCYIYTIVTGFWLMMVIIGKPLKSKAAFIIFIFNQAVRLVLGIFAVVLAENDLMYLLSPDMMLIMGHIMIWTVIGALAMNNLLSIGCVLYSIYENIKKRRKRKNRIRHRRNKISRIINGSSSPLRRVDESLQK